MRIKNAKKGTVVVNKVSGKNFMITDVTEDGGIVATAVEATKLEDGTWDTVVPYPDAENPVKISEKNCRIFSTVKFPDPSYDETDGIGVENGLLVKNEKPLTEQGKFVFDEILHQAKGKIFAATKPDKNGDRSIIVYDVNRDNFKVAVSGIPSSFEWVSFIPKQGSGDYRDGLQISAWFVYSEEEKTDESGEKTIEKIFDHTSIVSIDENGELSYFEHKKHLTGICNANVPEVVVFAAETKEGEKEYILATVDSWRQNLRMVIEKPICITKVQAKEPYVFIRCMNSLVYASCVYGSVAYEIKKEGIGKLTAGYDYLVDESVEGHTLRLFLANEECTKVKVVASKETKDRGYIVSVEEV